jgi:Domain of unknown function (DUF4386)
MAQQFPFATQAAVARLAGAMYLLTMATALFGEAYVRASLLVSESAARTAQNLVESNLLYRVGLATDLITFTGVVVLVWALYQLLKPVDGRLAALAAFFRLVELGVHFSVVAFGVAALSLLSGGEYVKGFSEAQLHGLVGFALRAQLSGFVLGFIPLGLGSAIFAFLLFRSGYVPRMLAAWGILASLLLAAYAMALVITPATNALFYFAMGPMFIYEVTLGAWLLFKGAAVGARGSA